MAAETARKPHAYAFVFRIGEQGEDGDAGMPAAYAASPCYVFRKTQKALAKHLAAIPEPDVDEDDVTAGFEAIEAFLTAKDLRAQLYTDAEVRGGRAVTERLGFHAGATFDEAKAALARGGFRVVDLGRPASVERDRDELARHLDLTSLAIALEHARGELGFDRRERSAAEVARYWRLHEFVNESDLHADTAAALVVEAIKQDGAVALTEAVRADALGWPAELRDTLLVLAAHKGLEHARDACGGLDTEAGKAALAALRSLLAALPPTENAAVRERLEAWELGGGAEVDARVPAPAKAPASPAVAPRKTKEVAFDPAKYAAKVAKIESAAKKAGVKLPRGASKKAIAATEAKLGVTFPAEVRAFYLAHDGGPDSEAVCGGRELLSLEGMVSQWGIWKELFDADELEDDSVEPDPGVQPKAWIPAWIPVTFDFGGNNDVIDLAPAKGGRLGQIVSVWHDDDTRTVEGRDFLSWLQKQTWGEGSDDDG